MSWNNLNLKVDHLPDAQWDILLDARCIGDRLAFHPQVTRQHHQHGVYTTYQDLLDKYDVKFPLVTLCSAR